mmetsp:Transcript_22023/g.61931  ORF Transcript_22023/g.61931 Transcript_22023/m.61931 type:complete len:272 (+) Transcript_22023:260-1075(+)
MGKSLSFRVAASFLVCSLGGVTLWNRKCTHDSLAQCVLDRRVSRSVGDLRRVEKESVTTRRATTGYLRVVAEHDEDGQCNDLAGGADGEGAGQSAGGIEVESQGPGRGVEPRRGTRPATRVGWPHYQKEQLLDEAAQTAIREELLRHLQQNRGVVRAKSKMERHAIALYLDDGKNASWWARLFQKSYDGVQGIEFAHVHDRPEDMSSWHVLLADVDAAHIVQQGWGEYFPSLSGPSQDIVLVYAPRSRTDIRVLKRILAASYMHAVASSRG